MSVDDFNVRVGCVGRSWRWRGVPRLNVTTSSSAGALGSSDYGVDLGVTH